MVFYAKDCIDCLLFRDRVSTELGPDVRVKPPTKILSRANGWDAQNIQGTQKLTGLVWQRTKRKSVC